VSWSHLHVTGFFIEEALSTPYQAKITLQARRTQDEVDPAELIGKLATLRIATWAEPPARWLHGLIVEAVELGASGLGMAYEVRLMPPLVRAMHRRRSRIFLEKTTRQILEAVLTGDPRMRPGDPPPGGAESGDDFVVPKELFAFRIRDPKRLDDVTARPYCVQYEESDFDFVARLLEEEGVAYHFEHTGQAVVLVLSDHDGGRCKLEPFDPLSPHTTGRHLDAVRLGSRLRPTRVMLTDYDWRKPRLDMAAEARGGDGDLFLAAYPGRYPDSPDQGEPLARALLERFQTEANFATAEGACRLLGAGTIFALDHPVDRYDGEYLVSRAELRGVAEGELAGVSGARDNLSTPEEPPFHARVECVRRGVGNRVEGSKFRPPRRTSKPRIQGSQTAIVMDEPNARGAEIHVGGPAGNENGCVRLKFHWDTEAERHRKEPASCWVRVSQSFAGAGGGAVWHPRVGTEVVVEFIDGDPDRPLVIGRVYNGVQKPPALGSGAATGSTLKSMSSPGGATYNELSFDDTAGKEQVKLFAGKDWTTEVGHDLRQTVTNDSTSTVHVNRAEETGANRKAHVGGANEESVDGDERVTVGGRQTVTITGGQDMNVTADRNLTVSGPHAVSTGPETYTVNGPQTVAVTAAKTETIGASLDQSVAAAMTVNAGASHTLNTPAETVNATAVTINSTTTTINAGTAASIDTTVLTAVAAGPVTLQGAIIAVAAAGEIVLSGGGSAIKISGSGVEITGGAIKIAGGTVDVTGGVVKVN
jgi:type VI secretion system secreted protein VgrG